MRKTRIGKFCVTVIIKTLDKDLGILIALVVIVIISSEFLQPVLISAEYVDCRIRYIFVTP